GHDGGLLALLEPERDVLEKLAGTIALADALNGKAVHVATPGILAGREGTGGAISNFQCSKCPMSLVLCPMRGRGIGHRTWDRPEHLRHCAQALSRGTRGGAQALKGQDERETHNLD